MNSEANILYIILSLILINFAAMLEIGMKSFEAGEMSPMEVQGLMQGAIGPRPICFASTVDKNGNANLSPFSFFNMFSSNPPILIFSPARRVRDNTIKHTLENVLEVPEVCINIVTYDMVWQTSLASTEYEKSVDEFSKAGFGKVASKYIKPARVAESPVQFECKVIEVKPLGEGGGAGNLVICEVLMIHVATQILSADGKKIDQPKLNLVARLGDGWYSKTEGALFEIEKPLQTKGIGVDMIPEGIRLSKFLTGNNLGQLGNVEHLPTAEEIDSVSPGIANKSEYEKHKMAHDLLEKKQVMEAWKILLS
jgi:flavin reductase (DIM6/NTAB) family NADH-FMN oxidoreductase RutF